MTTETTNLASMKKASELTGFAKSTIHRWVMDGKLKNHQTDQKRGAEVLVSIDELNRLIQTEGIKSRPKMQMQTTAKTHSSNGPGSLQSLQRARERYIERLEEIAGRLEEEIKLIEQKRAELAKVREEIERVKTTIGEP